jgi:hypothetical protein
MSGGALRVKIPVMLNSFQHPFRQQAKGRDGKVDSEASSG